ncbi:MAG: hypothetical protein ACXWK0_13510, partial [Caulobacteraceae bacterium]
MVFYVEAAPSRAQAVTSALDAEARNARKDGAFTAEVLRESGRPARMALVEQWRDLSEAEAGRRAQAVASRLEPARPAPLAARLR